MRDLSTHRHRVVATVVGLVALLSLIRASAQVEQISVQYQAPPGCPTPAQFGQAIQARTPKVRISVAPSATRSFLATISHTDGQFAGLLRAVETDGTVTVREVRGDECSETASALTFMIAVVVDPAAAAGPIAALSASTGPPASASLPRPPVLLVPLARRTRPPPEQRPWTWGTGAELLLVGGIAPELATGLTAFAQAEFRPERWTASPSLRLGLAFANNALNGGPNRTAAFEWIVARSQACPAALPMTTNARLSLCALAEAGAVTGEGRLVALPRRSVRAWAAGGLSTELSWALGRQWQLHAHVGGVVPISRPLFTFLAPRQVVFQSPWVVWSAGLGLGLLF